MPSDDIGHPIPDLSGYITEGQIVLSRELDRAGVYPPVNVLPSLSRLMKDGTGKGYTHADHPALASQLYAAYARATQARLLASVVGEDGLSDTDRRYLAFGTAFESVADQPVTRARHARGKHDGRLGPAARPCRSPNSRAYRMRRSRITCSPSPTDARHRLPAQ